MKRVWLSAVIAAAAVALAITGLTLSGPAQAVPARAKTVVFDCPGQHALVRPKTLVLACADGNALVDRLAWTSWTPGLASARGTLVQNDCMPYCAAGHFHRYPALVVLWGSKAVKNHPGERRYTELTLILTGPRPPFYDAVHHKWVTAPVAQKFPMSTGA
jgi:hypothetical protein